MPRLELKTTGIPTDNVTVLAHVIKLVVTVVAVTAIDAVVNTLVPFVVVEIVNGCQIADTIEVAADAEYGIIPVTVDADNGVNGVDVSAKRTLLSA